MFKKNNLRIFTIIIGITTLFLLVGCIGTSTDETQIEQIAKNLEKAIEEKDVDLFMENISNDYSDSEDGTYDNHINSLPEEIFSNIEENEDLIDSLLIFNFKIETEVTIPESDIDVTDIYASGKMEIKITLKGCLFFICTEFYNEITDYDVDFIKEDEDWKIISLEET